MNIGFDADGVLFDTEVFQLSNKVVSFMKDNYGLDVVNENGYGIKDVFGCSPEIEMDFWVKFVIKYSLLFKARPWTKEVIDILRKEGNKVYIVTSKACSLEKNYKGVCVRFLFELGLKLNGITVDGIEYCSLENGALSKLEACTRRNIKVLVEDKKENVEFLSKFLHVICIASKNNSSLLIDGVPRVMDMNEAYANIKRFIAKTTGEQCIFTDFVLKNKEEKKNMSVLERKEYYSMLANYYKALPFEHGEMKKSERTLSVISAIYSLYFNHKYSPIIIGRENIPSEKGNIFICNHLCSKDVLFLFASLRKSNEVWHPLAKQELSNSPFSILFNIGKAVYVKRTDSVSRHISTQELAKDVVNGYNVLIFPEGTYNRTNDYLKDFTGSSHVYLSQVLGRPIIPMALTKDYSIPPILRIGEPYVVNKNIDLEEAQHDSYEKVKKLVIANEQLLSEKRRI